MISEAIKTLPRTERLEAESVRVSLRLTLEFRVTVTLIRGGEM